MNSFLKYVLIIMMFTSCKNNTIYTKYTSITNNKWHQDSIVTFDVNIKDTISKHAVFINLRNDRKYEFNNIFLVTSIYFPNRTEVSDTLAYKMTDEKGYYLGTGVTDIKENKLEFRKQMQFPNKGVYTFSIQQAMRKNNEEKGVISLEGIVNVGIEIEKTTTDDN